MYESITFEILLKRMLDKVLEDYPDTDTREGSMIYNALAPAAVELQNMYIQLDVILNETFADSASREYLIKRAAERGINPSEATNSVLKGEFNIDVSIGKRFSLDDLNYIVTEKISTGIFKLECETPGEVGNQYLGTLIPIEYIDGLVSAELTQVLIPGEDEETTESLRKRYFSNINSQPFGGNIDDYKQKTNTIDGVGGVKVYPAFFGGGTVKLVIINSAFGVPSSTLIDLVQTTIDPTLNSGQGLGIAPIGHVVTIEGVNLTTVNIATTITYQDGWTFEDIEGYINGAVDDYFLELSKTWDDNENLIVRISQIESRLLDISGIIDVANTTINTLAQNLILDSNYIPVRGSISG